jgi:hypothetical protein
MNLTLNDFINNQNTTVNTLTTNRRTFTDGINNLVVPNMPPARVRVSDKYLIIIHGYVMSISTDRGVSFVSMNINQTIGDVNIINDTIYIFVGNTVKRIVPSVIDNSNIIVKDAGVGYSIVNPKQPGNFGKNGYAKYLNNIEVNPGDKINVTVTAPDGGVRFVWGSNRFFPSNAT